MVLDTPQICSLVDDSSRKQGIETWERDSKRKNAGSTKRAGLMDVRVIQRHLVYAVGLAADICQADSEQVLRGPEYFGKYGRIKKISVTWNNNTCPARQASAAAYVLYHTEEEAWNCIQAVDGVTWSGKQVRACYGTTKYCHSYLRKATCNNPECSYLHEPAPEEDTVTKDEMNPITGRKDILHLVHPGGTPRSRSKKAPPCPVTKAIDVPPATAAAVTPDGPSSSSPSKSSPGWAIPAPNGHDAIGTAMLESSRESGSIEDSPQFVISASAESAAWPALSESIPTSDLQSETFSRPSAKDVVTGTASTYDSKDTTCIRMMPLSVPSRPRIGTRTAAPPAPSIDQPPSSTDEHALSTMPSSELFVSRGRPEVLTEAIDCVAPLTFCTPDDATDPSQPSTEPAPIAAAAQIITDQHTADSDTGDSIAKPAPHTGERLLSALDLLPAALEDALEGSHSLPRAPSRDPDTMSVPNQNPSPAVPASAAMDMDLATVQHRPNRKQSRFAFVQSESNSKSTSTTSLSPAKDLNSFSDAPAFTPASSGAQLYTEASAISHDRRQGSAPPAFNNLSVVDNRLRNQTSREGQFDSMLGVHQPQPRPHSGPTSQSTLDHPPMTHESVVQAVSAQLQAMLQGGSTAPSNMRTNEAMLPMSAAPHQPGKWQQGKVMQDSGLVDQVPSSDVHLLQALLQQEVSAMSESVHVPQNNMRQPNMATGRQGLTIKRPTQVPQALPASVHPGMHPVQYQKVPHNSYLHQRNPGIHERTHRFSQGAPAQVPASMAPAIHPSYGVHRGNPYISAAMAMEQSLHQARSIHHVPRYSEGGYAMDGGVQYNGWESDMYNNMISALQAQQQRQQMASAARWHARAPGGHWE